MKLLRIATASAKKRSAEKTSPAKSALASPTTPPASKSAPMIVVAVPRRPHHSAAKKKIARPIVTRAIPSAAPLAKAGSSAMIPAATATAPNDISTFIASDPVSRLASAWSRSASCVVSLASSTSRVMSRTILMAGLLASTPTDFASVRATALGCAETGHQIVKTPTPAAVVAS